MISPNDFPDEEIGKVIRNMSELGIEKSPDEWRQFLVFLCDLHCAQHPEHGDLPALELWPIVEARLNDQQDSFPESAT